MIKNNVKHILLKPHEIKSIYWISKIPEDLADNSVYTSILEVKDSFSSISRTEVYYTKNGRAMDINEASNLVSKFSEREEKEVFSDVSIKCSYENKEYYSDEDIEVNCNVKNFGTKNLRNFNFCLNSECFIDNLNIGESKTFTYIIKARESALFVVEDDKFIKKENLEFSIIKIPNIYISEISPSEVDYNTNAEISFFINSEFEVKNVVIFVDSIGEIKIGNLIGRKLVTLDINSRKLVSGLNLDINYEDLEGNKFSDKKSYPVIVKKIPLRAELWRSLKNFFN